MSKLSKNQLFSRRGFMRSTLGTATLASAGVGLVSMPGTFSYAESRAGNPWAYDDSEYRRTDPKLIRYQETRRFQVARSSPRCICLTGEEHLLVGAGKSVIEYGLDGTQISQFTLASEVRCLAASRDGLIYAGLRDHVEIYDGKGQHRGTWESPGKKAYLTGLAVGESDVFVADAGQRIVVRYDRSGSIKGRIGEPTAKAGGFIVPSPFFDVEIGADGLLRVANPGRHCVEAYTFDGGLEFSWGQAGAGIEKFCGCCNPINLALGQDGRVITFEKGIPRVKVYGSQGSFEGVVAGAESFSENAKVCGPQDCTLGGLDGVVDAKGRIHILDLVAGNIRTMERKSHEG